jgi:hypothetical protein
MRYITKRISIVAVAASCFGGVAYAGETAKALPVELKYDTAPPSFVSGTPTLPSPSSYLARGGRRLQDDPPPVPSWSGGGVLRLSGDREDRLSVGAFKNIKAFQWPNLVILIDAYGGVSLVKKVAVPGLFAGMDWHPHDDLTVGFRFGGVREPQGNIALAIGGYLNMRF